MSEKTVNIKNNSKNVIIIPGDETSIIIKPLHSEPVPAKLVNHPRVKIMIAKKDLEILSEDQAELANDEVARLIAEREALELEELKKEAKELGIMNAHNMKRETLVEKIAEVKAASGQ